MDPLVQALAAQQQPMPPDLDRQRTIGLIAALTGNRQLGTAGDALTANANQQQQFAMQAPHMAAQTAKLQQEVQQAGPQEALGGQTPSNYEMLTKRQQVPKFAVNPATGALYNTRDGRTSGGGGNASTLAPAALDQAAELFHTTGQIPSIGMGSAGAMTRRQIINRAAELHPDTNLAGNKADYKANSASLGGMQKMADTIDAFEKTSLGNLQNFLTISQNAVDTGSPIINQPARWFTNKVLGDPDIAAYHTARQVAVQEIGKVLGGAVAGGAISDSQRHEVESLLPPDATGAQIASAAKILIQDMATRKAAVADQIGTIRGRIGGAPAASPAAAPTAAATDTAALRKKYGL